MTANKVQNKESSPYRWIIVFTAFFTFVTFAFAFQSMPPLLRNISQEFGLSETESGLLMSMVVIPGVILALPAGLIVNRYGFRLMGIPSTFLVAIGSLTTALADNFLVALLGRLILGIGGAFIVVGVPTVIPQWFSPKDLGKAMGIYATSMPVATILAFPTATILANNFGWHYPFYISTGLSFVGALIFVLTMREGPLKKHTKQVSSGEVKLAFQTDEVWKSGLIWMFFNMTALAFLSWGPTLFERFKGLDSLYASFLTSILMYGALLFVPIFGWASDSWGRRKPFIVAGFILMIIALNMIAYTTNLLLLSSVIFLGVTAAMVPPIIMTIAASSLPPGLSGTVFSVVTLCQNLGIAFSAPLAGYILQVTESIQLTLFGVSLFAVTGTLIALTSQSR
ncbi:MFS transporter [Candidatus Bathyarchaeota archaeon]|nr:MFS transporter [Candidatus Bathyarchaeota archaeon]